MIFQMRQEALVWSKGLTDLYNFYTSHIAQKFTTKAAYIRY